ncbi:hypothetical protein [Mesorhizobium sp. KR9-304]|uniref:hypothetical protein n=1 Tax=Mesorhizobium sp. KR9-304 TaxID=3156614 RepID=UPI0032B625E6
MRVVGIVFFLAAFGAAHTHASSIVTLDPSEGDDPSIITLGDQVEIDPSIVAAVSETGPSPSIIALADTPTTPSIITLGGPAGEEDASATPSQRMSIPMIIRGGEVGAAAARPAPAQAATQPGVPLLDPNDRGTPSKRKALKRQAARLAEEAAAAAQNPQPDPSTEPVPFGQ